MKSSITWAHVLEFRTKGKPTTWITNKPMKEVHHYLDVTGFNVAHCFNLHLPHRNSKMLWKSSNFESVADTLTHVRGVFYPCYWRYSWSAANIYIIYMCPYFCIIIYLCRTCERAWNTSCFGNSITIPNELPSQPVHDLRNMHCAMLFQLCQHTDTDVFLCLLLCL